MALNRTKGAGSGNSSKSTAGSSSKRGTSTSRKSADLRSQDPLDQIIFEGGLRIGSVEPLYQQGLIVILLNTGTPLLVRTSDHPRLAKATEAQLRNWELISGGTAIGWEELDEHLSLKGFLLTEVRNEVMDRLQALLAKREKAAGRNAASSKMQARVQRKK